VRIVEREKSGDFQTTVFLVRAAQKGEGQALEDLITRFLPFVRRIVALRMGKRLRSFLDHEDILQEVLIKIFQGIDRFAERSEGSFRNWLSRCVECELTDSARKARAKKRGGGNVIRFGDCSSSLPLSSVIPARSPTASAILRGKEMEERIEEALLEMPKQYREVIILRILCGMSYQEVARTMGFAQESTARKAFSRALRKLEEMLKLRCPG